MGRDAGAYRSIAAFSTSALVHVGVMGLFASVPPIKPGTPRADEITLELVWDQSSDSPAPDFDPLDRPEPEPEPQPPPEPEQPTPPEVRLGLVESPATDTPSWIGFSEATDHQAPMSDTVQPALVLETPGFPDAGSGPALPASPPPQPEPPRPTQASALEPDPPAPVEPSPREAIPTEIAPAPPAPTSTDQPTLDEPGPANRRPPPSPVRPQEPFDAPAPPPGGIGPPVLMPEQTLAPAPRPDPPDPEMGPPTPPSPPASLAPVREPAAARPQTPVPPSATPNPPNPPTALTPPTTPAPQSPSSPPSPATNGTGPRGTPDQPGRLSDRESSPTALDRPQLIRPGKVLAIKGELEVRTRRPSFDLLPRANPSTVTVVIRVRFDRRGVPVEHEWIERTGNAWIDDPIVNSVYLYRASGPALERLPADDPKAALGLTLVIRLSVS